jgi:hypothetical protein
VTEVGRALKELGIRMIPAYSPQARGRSERSFGTWQGRLPQELRLKNIRTPEQANAFLRDHYIGEFNGKFTVPAAETGTAFAPIHRQDLDRVFAIQQERVVGNDNTIQFANHVWQIPPTPFRTTLAGCRVIVYEHLDATFSVGYGPHTVARFTASGDPVSLPKAPAPRRTPPHAKTTRAVSPISRRTWPISDPGAKILRRKSLRAERRGQPAARPAPMGASASAPPQDAPPYGLRWGFAPADAPIGAEKGSRKRTQTKNFNK